MRASVYSLLVVGLLLSSLSDARGQWEPASGSGLAATFKMSLSKGDTLFLSALQDLKPVGFYRSIDNGITWTPINGFGAGVRATDGTAIYATSGNPSVEVQLSTDGGTTWVLSSQGLPTSGLLETIVCSKGNAIIGSNTALYVTTDHGGSWQKATAGVPPTLAVSSLSASSNVALAFTNYGEFRSINGGITWSLVNLNPSQTQVFAGGKEFYAIASNIDGVSFSASVDSGVTFAQRTAVLPDYDYNFTTFAFAGDSIFMNSPDGRGVYFSTDDGRTWPQINTGLQDWLVRGVCANSGYVFAGTDLSLFRMERGTVLWRTLPCEIMAAYNLAYAQGVLFTDGLRRSTDKGQTWVASNEGIQPDAGSPANMVAKDSLLFTSGYKWIFRSTDKGITWTPVNQQFADPNSNVTTLAVFDSVIFAGVGDEAYRSSDNGNTWAVCKTGMRRNLINRFVPSEHFIFAATDSGLHRSSDNGFTWSPIPFTSGLWGIVSTDVFVAGSKIFVGTRQANSGIYLSTDEGDTWILSNNGLQYPDAKWHFRQINSMVFAMAPYSGGSGIYKEVVTDSGTTWSSMWQELGTSIYDIVSDSVYAYIATGTGVYRRPLSELTSVTVPWVKVPEAFTLSQNYPNPFNPSTRIGYDLPHRSHVFLAVYNALGQKVAELVNGEIEAGHHEVQFDGSDLASGVYFYRLQAGEFLQTRKLLLLR